jgi:hypothetical protein
MPCSTTRPGGFFSTLACAVALAGCNTEVTVDPDPNRGRLTVEVRDAAGRVPGALLNLRSPEGEVSRFTTFSDRAMTTSGRPGTWQVSVTPPSTHTVPATQPNPVSVPVARGENRTLEITLARKP